MNKFVDREIEKHSLPLSSGLKLLSTEKLVIEFYRSHTIDYGALCYLHRADEKRKAKKGIRVDLSSLSEDRIGAIQSLIQQISHACQHSGRRLTTEYTRQSALVRFINWCDRNGYTKVLTCVESARAALQSYMDELRRLADQNLLNVNSAADYQDQTILALEEYFDVEDLGKGINKLVASDRFSIPTRVPDDTAQEMVLAWCKCLLEGLTALVVERLPYPFSLHIPAYLNWPNNSLWIFPTMSWCMTPDSASLLHHRGYDYENGRIRTREEVENLYVDAKNKQATDLLLKRAQRYIDRSNNDPFSKDRIQRGTLAMSAFLLMFIASTGCNRAQAIGMPWSEDLEEAARNPLLERQHFRTIKYRANNRQVAFEIGVEYMPYFRRFLQLRNYLLMGRRSEYLFFGYGSNLSHLETGPIPASSFSIQKLYITLTRLSPTLPKVVPKQWRAAKQDHVSRHRDPATAALAMQHSLDTALKKYTNGSEVHQQLELTSYFSQVESVVLKSDEKTTGSEVRSIGLCISPKNPKSVTEIAPIVPDCTSAEGCLFCDKFRVHADEKDVRKLLSARYCIKATSHLATSVEQFERLFGSALARIERILIDVRRNDHKLVDHIEKNVDNEGELDPFWSAKLEMLMALELA